MAKKVKKVKKEFLTSEKFKCPKCGAVDCLMSYALWRYCAKVKIKEFEEEIEYGEWTIDEDDDNLIEPYGDVSCFLCGECGEDFTEYSKSPEGIYKALKEIGAIVEE
jgi:predicted RNA-binding Zn-ribbon protein involved in translation (DUF1610 family)